MFTHTFYTFYIQYKSSIEISLLIYTYIHIYICISKSIFMFTWIWMYVEMCASVHVCFMFIWKIFQFYGFWIICVQLEVNTHRIILYEDCNNKHNCTNRNTNIKYIFVATVTITKHTGCHTVTSHCVAFSCCSACCCVVIYQATRGLLLRQPLSTSICCHNIFLFVQLFCTYIYTNMPYIHIKKCMYVFVYILQIPF